MNTIKIMIFRPFWRFPDGGFWTWYSMESDPSMVKKSASQYFSSGENLFLPAYTWVTNLLAKLGYYTDDWHDGHRGPNKEPPESPRT